jgi:hypothetical protein
MIRAVSAALAACVLALGLTAAPAVAGPAPFCTKVRHCVWGGDPGWTWVHAAASSKRKARAVAARVLRNAKAARKRYGAPRGVTIHVVRTGACWRKYRAGEIEPTRSCTLRKVQRRL